MAFLIIGSGGGAVVVPVNRFREREPYRVGDQKRAADGTLRSDVSLEMRSFEVESLMTRANLALLEPLVTCDTEQQVQGDALRNGNVPLTCQIRLTDRPFEHDTGIADGFQVTVSMRIEQVL